MQSGPHLGSAHSRRCCGLANPPTGKGDGNGLFSIGPARSRTSPDRPHARAGPAPHNRSSCLQSRGRAGENRWRGRRAAIAPAGFRPSAGRTPGVADTPAGMDLRAVSPGRRSRDFTLVPRYGATAAQSRKARLEEVVVRRLRPRDASSVSPGTPEREQSPQRSTTRRLSDAREGLVQPMQCESSMRPKCPWNSSPVKGARGERPARAPLPSAKRAADRRS